VDCFDFSSSGRSDFRLNKSGTSFFGDSIMHLSSRSSDGLKPYIACLPAPIIFIVDDDASLPTELGIAVQAEGWQLASYDRADDFLSCWDVSVPCCLVLGGAIPSLTALGLIKHVLAERPDIPVIFIANQSDVSMAVQAMKAGAREVFTRHFNISAMLDAIRDAIRYSEAARQRAVSARLLKQQLASLSKREREVMTLIVRGLMNKQVGAILGISEITVKAHRGRVMQKMHVATFVDLVNKAAQLRFEIGRSIETKNVADLAPYRIDIFEASCR
jgi:FixJ family two-component response regulator